MNERIKELAEQTGFSMIDIHQNPDDLEKFAELIVKACIDLVATRPYIDDGNWSHPSMMIKQYFGVE